MKETLTIGLANGESIEVTPEHLIKVNGEWKSAKNIKVGQLLYSLGDQVAVVKIRVTLEKLKVYNISVADNKNYFVGKDKFLVHNISPCEQAAQALARTLPKACMKLGECKDFQRRLESLLKQKDVKGKRICLQSKAGIYSDKMDTHITETGEHLAVQVGDLVFDSLNPDGTPYADWFNDLGGSTYIQPPGGETTIELFFEEFDTPTGCKK